MAKRGKKTFVEIKTKPEEIISKPAKFPKNGLLMLAAVLILTFIAFIPSLSNQFVPSWDDNMYVTDNHLIRELSWDNVFTYFTIQKNGTYVPIPLITWAIEYHFFGFDPFPYHLNNLLLHLLCTSLVFYFFYLLKIPIRFAAFGALLFGIHPMRVESVAWVSERKDLLFSLFYLLSLTFYLKFIQSANRKREFFLLTIFFFILSLFSKIQAVSLSLSLVLIDYWLSREINKKLILEKIPFFFLSLCFGVGGFLILHNTGVIESRAVSSEWHGIFFAFSSLTAYLVKMAAPFNLSAHYPWPSFPANSLPIIYYLNVILLAGASIVLFIFRNKIKPLIFGLLFFIFNIMFLLQFVRAGEAYQADRFTYIPYIGLIFTIIWTMNHLSLRGRTMQFVIIGFGFAAAAAFCTLTYSQCKVWKNNMTLWEDVIKKEPAAPLAYNNRGVALSDLGDKDKAIAEFTKSIELDTAYSRPYYNRGNTFMDIRKFANAIDDFTHAIAIKPDKFMYINRGSAYCKIQKYDVALADFEKAVTIDPNDAIAVFNRGYAYAKLGNLENAINDYTTAISLNQGLLPAYNYRGTAYAAIGKLELAAADFKRALQIDPVNSAARKNLEAINLKLMN